MASVTETFIACHINTAPEAEQAFVKTHNELKEKFNNDALILFIDGVHPTQGTKLAYGWMQAGKKSQPVETTDSCTPSKHHGGSEPERDIGSTVVREYDSINSFNIA